jgi:hypothetical protein
MNATRYWVSMQCTRYLGSPEKAFANAESIGILQVHEIQDVFPLQHNFTQL